MQEQRYGVRVNDTRRTWYVRGENGQLMTRNSADFAGCLVTVLLLLWLVAMWILCKVLIG